MLQTADSCIYMHYSNMETLATSDKNCVFSAYTRWLIRLPIWWVIRLFYFASFYLFLLTNRIFVLFNDISSGPEFLGFPNSSCYSYSNRKNPELLYLWDGTLCNNAFLWEHSGSPFLPRNILKYFLNTTVYYCSDGHQSSQLCFLDWAPGM